MNLRYFLTQNPELLEEVGTFEIYRAKSDFLPYYSYYYIDSKFERLRETRNFLVFAEKIVFTDEDDEPIYEISLDEDFEIEGGDGDWFLHNKDWSIYV